MSKYYSLSQLGWQAFFQHQLSLEEWESCQVARIEALERSTIFFLTTSGTSSLPLSSSMPAMTVGDWILLNNSGLYLRCLDRLSLFSRKAAGTKVATQLIAANVDTVFIVSSLNKDFNLNRVERYLSLTNEISVDTVFVLTKEDCCSNTHEYINQVQQLSPLLNVLAVNSLNSSSVKQLSPWCCEGKTVAFLGSSGVGKSSIINTLLGHTIQQTNSIRGDDDKGRHTTTQRTLHLLPTGGILIDTPGMRELKLSDCEQGIEDTFSEISEYAKYCKFSDCQHENEPGCAVKKAIDSNKLDKRRLTNYRKLMREQEFNTATIAEKRAREKKLGRYIRAVQAESKMNR